MGCVASKAQEDAASNEGQAADSKLPVGEGEAKPASKNSKGSTGTTSTTSTSKGHGSTSNSKSNTNTNKMSKNPTVVFDTTMGAFEAEVFLKEMPVTASNFLDLCKTGFYDGVHFHRVIPGFMNQFGCPHAKNPKARNAGTGGPKPNSQFTVLDGSGKVITRDSREGCIPDEFAAKITNDVGTLSMANTGQKNSGGSQFFINVNHNDFLDWFSPGESKHPVFGKITKNMDLVVAISNAPTVDDNPKTPIMMKSITVKA